MSRNYVQVEEGEWISVPRKTSEACCDCGLVHDVQYRINSRGSIEFRVKRNPRKTAAHRRRMNKILRLR
jgi:hypothetical protein